MQKWEYLVIMYGQDGWYFNGVPGQASPTTAAWDILRQRGFEGWELVAVDMGVLYLKRPRMA